MMSAAITTRRELAPGHRSGSRKAGLNGIRVGRVWGYQFIGLSETIQNTYSNIESSPTFASAITGRTAADTDAELCPTVQSENLRMYANAKTLNDQVLKSRVIRATTRFSLSATEEDGAVVSLGQVTYPKRSSVRCTWTADQKPPPRGVGMPASFRPAAMALSDSAPPACNFLMVSATSLAR